MELTYGKNKRNKRSETVSSVIRKADRQWQASEKESNVISAKNSGPRDKWSFRTHFAGVFLGIAATIYMWITRWGSGAGTVASFVIFGLSIIALYSCSAIYHYSNGSAERVMKLRKLDHSMIYVLIAGSYTPVLYNCLDPGKGTIFLACMWALAATGVIIKVCWFGAPRWLYTGMYVLMGWAIAFDPHALLSLSSGCLWFLVAGGLSYTVGAVFYAFKKPNISDEFGFHELFHCFILLGTVFQFISIAVFI